MVPVFQFLCRSWIIAVREMHIILELIIMKSTSYKNSRKEFNEKTNLWDAFTNYLESIFFPGVSELLDTQLVVFEYESLKQLYSH